jgi:DNA invertase Pin-like site-specific DNA recombinase
LKKDVLHIYIRVSTLAQADKGTSLESQQQLGIKRAKELKFDYEIWNEGGKSSHHEEIQGRPKQSKRVTLSISGFTTNHDSPETIK